MAQIPDDSVDSFMQGLEEDLDHGTRGWGLGLPDESRARKKRLLYGALTVVILMVLFGIFFGSCEKRANEETQELQARLSELEARLQSIPSLERRIENLEQQLAALKRASALTAAAASASPGQGPREGRRAHIVKPGESLYLIAKKNNLTISELCRFNQITPKEVIRPGQKLWLEP